LDSDDHERFWLNLLAMIETPALIKLSQKQYTFLLHLIDEIDLFLDVLLGNKQRRETLKHQTRKSCDESQMKVKQTNFTICLDCPSSLTLVVFDGLRDTLIDQSRSSSASILPTVEKEPSLRDSSDIGEVVDLVTAPATIIAGTASMDEHEQWNVSIDDDADFTAFHSETDGHEERALRLTDEKKHLYSTEQTSSPVEQQLVSE
jgi:hypothetical protein